MIKQIIYKSLRATMPLSFTCAGLLSRFGIDQQNLDFSKISFFCSHLPLTTRHTSAYHTGTGSHAINRPRHTLRKSTLSFLATTATTTADSMSMSSSSSGSSNTTSTTTGCPQLLLGLPESIDTLVSQLLLAREVLRVTAACTRLQASRGWYACEKRLYLYWHSNLHGSTLAKLLWRFHRVTDLSASSTRIFLPLAIAISLDACKHLRELYISNKEQEKVPAQLLDALGTAIDAGTMPALQTLGLCGDFENGGVHALLRGFCKGASPDLHGIDIPFASCREPSGSGGEDEEDDAEDGIDWVQTEENVGALAAMLEARKRLGYCAGLKDLPYDAFEHCSVDVNMRLLRTTFCTLEEMVLDSYMLDDSSHVLGACLADVIESEQILLPRLAIVRLIAAFHPNSYGATRFFQAMGNNLSVFRNAREFMLPQRNLRTEALHALISTFKKDTFSNLEKLYLCVGYCQKQ